ncbi:MAG: hypothetical protein KAR38_01610 [Calditrichia bacterium]|nr:hypothetical protein [Calditrichia bacterium]
MNGISGEIQPFIGGIENTPHASEFSNRKQSEALNVQNKSGIIGELTEEEKQEVAQLKKIDAKIRAHEMAHLAASAGISVSGARFDYKTGPDGQIYAVAVLFPLTLQKLRMTPKLPCVKRNELEAQH